MLLPSARNTCFLNFVLLSALVLATGASAAAQDVAITPQPGGTSAAKPSSTSVAIVVDESKAARYKGDQLRKVVSEFMQAFTSDDEVCMYFAGEKPTLAQDFTADTTLVTKALKELKPKGKLGLYDSVSAAVDHLRSDATMDRAAVIVFTAGADSGSHTAASGLEAKLKGNPGVPFYAVALPGLNLEGQTALQQVAIASGGRAFFPSGGGQLKEASALAAQGVFGRSAAEVAKNKAAERKPLTPYKSIVVRSVPLIENNSTSGARGGENILLQHVLVARLQKSKLFSEVVDASTMDAAQTPVPPASEPGIRLELLATLVGFEKGNRLSWKFLGAGGTRMKVQVVLRDAATQQPVLSLVQEGSAASGLLSGGEEQVQSRAVLRAANGIIDQLRKAK